MQQPVPTHFWEVPRAQPLARGASAQGMTSPRPLAPGFSYRCLSVRPELGPS